MARLTKRELIAAADAVCACIQDAGEIPQWLLDAVQQALPKTSIGVRLAFVERVQQKCPEALKLFK